MGIEEARNALGDIVDRAALAGEPTTITRQGKPRAIVVSTAWFEERVEAQAAEYDGQNGEQS